MKKKWLSLALAGVLLLCCTNNTALAAGNTVTHKQDISMGDNKVTGQMALEISNVTSELSLTAKEIVAKYPLSEEQKSRGYYADLTSDYKWSVYECSVPAKVELKNWATYFVAWHNPSVNKDSITFNEVSRTEYDEDLEEDVKSFLQGTYFMFNEPGTYVIDFSQGPFGFNPFLVVVNGANNTSNVTPSQPVSNNTIKVMFKGSELKFTLPILNRNERTFYPMRELLESLGAKVDWNGTTKTAIGTLGDNKVEFDIDSDTYRINGVSHKMDTKAFIENGKTYIPIRYACEGLGFTVGWDGANNTIYIGDKTADKVGLHELKNMGGVAAAEDNSNGTKKITVRGSEVVPFNLNNGAASQWGGVALDGKYASIIGKLATNDARGGTLKIYGDDNLLGEYKCVAGDSPIDIDITLIGVKTLRIDVSIGNFYNIELEKLK